MPMIKHTTGFCPPPPPPPDGEPCPPIPVWKDHPSWITGLQALEQFHHWVASAVLPVAFQWIEEHYEEVYSSIPKEYRDDVGVVIARAFEMVRELRGYERGKEAFKKLEEERERVEQKHEKFDPKTINPVWAKITSEVQKATKKAFEAERKYLDDTI